MTNRLRIAVAIALGFTAGCVTLPSPTPITGPRDAVQALAGEWSGYYVGTESRRSGSVSFSLTAGDTIAYGDVVMVPREFVMRNVAKGEVVHVEPRPTLLQITFVNVNDGNVTGVLEPYMDPACDCLVVTTFTGRMGRKGRIEGTFVTRIVGTSEQQSGRWEVRRKGH